MYIKSYSEAEGFSLSNPINRQENLNMKRKFIRAGEPANGIYRTKMWSYKNLFSELQWCIFFCLAQKYG